jgi:hypothetical protein
MSENGLKKQNKKIDYSCLLSNEYYKVSGAL